MSTKEANIDVIDWKGTILLANNNPKLAKQLLDMFTDELPTTRALFTTALEVMDIDALLKHAHKLHGATCYCKTPSLTEAVTTLETALKSNNHKNIDLLVNQVCTEIYNVVDLYQNIKLAE